ncbi:hypothetical protein [Mycolicibacterium arseniciresistens]|jgi:hypothetical protein|uniref:Secreted protein n=1 Tax=Mycolicibacterium arseniciresistens TaxID=3062257 RepID=A0ABT8U9T9_9MYCO|nr:hypothetical protein [Mycolicibacterium arseniciresistens]MDO3634563.1 hypothetical protein [Mycolicibacterium arseniciresistens]
MKKNPVLKKAIAAALLSATFATPAAVLTAGSASARPVESPNCHAISEAFESSMIAARVAKQQGDEKARQEWLRDAGRAKANYNRHCLS